ncbi:MAG: cytochrome c family protein [Draconibacterium sp.]
MNLKKLVFLLGIAVFVSSTAFAQDFKYIGAAKCKMCHNKPEKGEQYNKWAAGPHAKAMESLKGDDAKNPKCLKCHSTAASVDKSLLAGIKVEEGVSCESCHGPGSVYKTASIMKNQKMALSKGLIMPTEQVCKQCHNEESPNYKGFNFKEYVAKIAHDDPTTTN